MLLKRVVLIMRSERIRYLIKSLLVYLMVICICVQTNIINTGAHEVILYHLQHEKLDKDAIISKDSVITSRASGSINMNVPGNSIFTANQTFPLEVGEKIIISASYSPKFASMDFGIISADNMFYFITISNGSINKSIEISERGNYIFAVRNNSSDTVTVTGFVEY